MKLIKTLLLISCLIVVLAKKTFATDYYVSNTGNDLSNGTSESTPFKTLDKVNTVVLVPGDRILLKRGDVFNGTLRIKQNGTAENRIIITSYGDTTKPKPVISGFQTITGWTIHSGNIYKSSYVQPNVEIVIVNGKVQGMGRYPNSNFVDYYSPQGDSIFVSKITPPLDFVGGEAVIRRSYWFLDRNIVKEQQGNVIHVQPNAPNRPLSKDTFGFFFQKHINTLDTDKEWYAGPDAFYMYFQNSPSNYTVKAASHDTLMRVHLNKKYITIDGLHFEGASEVGLFLDVTNDVTVKNCSFYGMGSAAFRAAYGSERTLVDSCYFDQMASQGVTIANASHYSKISNSVIKNVNSIEGSGFGDAETIGAGVNFGNSTNCVFEYNVLDSIGHIGVRWSGKNDTIRYNLISNTGLCRNDVGAIYSWTSNVNREITGSVVHNNIMINNTGTARGVPKKEPPHEGSGIYMDVVRGVKIYNNHVYNAGVGIFFQGFANAEVTNNKVLGANRAAVQIIDRPTSIPFDQVVVKGNYFIAKTSEKAYFNLPLTNQPVTSSAMWFRATDSQTFPPGITLDQNIYARPIDNNYIISSKLASDVPWFGRRLTLAEWKTASGQDANSTTLSRTIQNEEDIIFRYNASKGTVRVQLDAMYEDTETGIIASYIDIAPYSSAILMKTNNPMPPELVLVMPGNKTIVGTLTTLSATVSGGSGHYSFLWEKVTGGNAIIDNEFSQTINVSGLQNGTYVFRCTVTDSNNQTATGTVTVSVIPGESEILMLKGNVLFRNL